VIIRIWRTAIDAQREDEYRRFEEEQSLAMFRQQPGFLGVLFLRSEVDAAALTIWESREHVDRLADAPSYVATVERLQQTGLLCGEQSIEVFDLVAGDLAAALSAIARSG
jgi:heme-degrading monooxygenase HmoA